VEYTVGCIKPEVVRISGAEKLQCHFHQLFASQLSARKRLKYGLAMICVQLLALLDATGVCILEF